MSQVNRYAVLVVLALAGMAMLSGCTSGGGSANNPALAAKVQNAIKSSPFADRVRQVSAESDGKVTVTLSAPVSGSDTSFQEKAVPQTIALEVLHGVPGVKQLTLSWDGGAQIGVWTAK